MRFGGLALALLAAGASDVLGHNGQFLLAKVIFPEPGRVQLEVTVDYAANPMVQTEAEASEALCGALRVIEEGRFLATEELGPVRIEKRVDLDPSCPLSDSPPSSPAEPDNHQMLTAIWSWPTRAKALAFEVPKGVPHDVILWRVDGTSGQRARHWFYLIAGDRTASMPLPDPLSNATLWATLAFVVVFAGAAWVVGRRRIARLRARPSASAESAPA